MNCKHLLIVTAACSLASLSAQADTRSESPHTVYWSTVNTTSVGRETPRTEFVTYADKNAALSRNFDRSPYYLLLNGEWDFRFYEAYGQVEANALTDKTLSWDKIKVPGNWELQGYGTAIYTNHPYEFSPRNPRPPMLPEANPVGIYRRTFSLDGAWRDRDIYLNLCGAKSGVYLYINGREVGYSEDSKDLAQFCINDFVKEGENEIVLKIYRWSTGSYLECQDFWRISGIERDVYLSSTPRNGIFDFTILSTLDDTYRNGLFSLTVQTQGHPTEIGYELIDRTGKVVASDKLQSPGEKVDFGATLPNVESWSAEAPNLYTLLIASTSAAGKEYTAFNVGFRRFEMSQTKQTDAQGRPYNVLLVNGQPIKFKGVNVHEHNPATGHYVTDKELLRDIELMRLNNINAIRTCHYPQSRRFYELCDEYGIYVYCEANIESHGMGYDISKGRSLANNRDWLAPHMDRIVNMYQRCKNYPSVAIWSLGNEAGNGYNFYRGYEYLEQLEKGEGRMNRPICYERAQWEWNSDMYVPQYPSADWLESIGRNGSDRPVIPSEYAHAMGNSTGGLAKQWLAINRYPNLQGAFIWDWIDQGFDATDAEGRPYWTYGGDYGKNTPSDANFLCNGIVNPDRTPHPAMAEVKYAYQNIGFEAADLAAGQFRILNRNYFTSLDNLVVRYEITEEERVIARGERRFSTAANATEQFAIALPAARPQADRYITFRVSTTAADRMIPAGHEIAHEQFLLAEATARPEYVPVKTNKQGTVTTTGNISRLALGKATLDIDRRTGCITSYRVSGKEQLADGFGIRPNFWRAPTDNDYGNGLPARLQAWKQLTLAIADPNSGACREVVTSVEESSVPEVSAKVSYSTPLAEQFDIHYTLCADGTLSISSVFVPSSEVGDEIPRVGFRMRLPQSAEEFTYCGRGPEENYIDRKLGTPIGVYRTSASAEYFPYVRPQECGHHCDTKWIRFANLSVVAAKSFEFNALRQTVENLDSEENTQCDYQWQNFTKNERHDPAQAKNQMRRQHHINDVKSEPFVELSIDHAQTGVGGYDSWGSRPDVECRLAPRRIEWQFTLVPTSAASGAKATSRSYNNIK